MLKGNLNDIVNHSKMFIADLSSGSYKVLAAKIQCRDGALLSVQASHGHYCDPEDDIGPYTTVEVQADYCKVPKSWKKYQSGYVYGHVPVNLVQRFITAHGGEVDD